MGIIDDGDVMVEVVKMVVVMVKVVGVMCCGDMVVI